jgi:hypothetical protein
MIQISLRATLADDPSTTAQWVNDFYAALPADLTELVAVTPPGGAGSTGDSAEEETAGGSSAALLDVNGQLDRLKTFWPSFAGRLQRLHDGLVSLGYEPRVPEQRSSSSRQASYVSYVDPADGRNLGNTNSGTFYFMPKKLTEELAGHEFVKVGRHASVHFDTDAKVHYILDVAKAHKK